MSQNLSEDDQCSPECLVTSEPVKDPYSTDEEQYAGTKKSKREHRRTPNLKSQQTTALTLNSIHQNFKLDFSEYKPPGGPNVNEELYDMDIESILCHMIKFYTGCIVSVEEIVASVLEAPRNEAIKAMYSNKHYAVDLNKPCNFRDVNLNPSTCTNTADLQVREFLHSISDLVKPSRVVDMFMDRSGLGRDCMDKLGSVLGECHTTTGTTVIELPQTNTPRDSTSQTATFVSTPDVILGHKLKKTGPTIPVQVCRCHGERETKERKLNSSHNTTKTVLKTECSETASESTHVKNTVKFPDRKDGKISVEDQRLNVADGKVPEKHQRLNVADGKIPEKHQRLNAADGKIPEKHQRLNVADGKIPEKHQRLNVADGKIPEKNQRLNVADGKIPEKNQRLNVADGKIPEKNQKLNVADGKIPEKNQRLNVADGKIPEKNQKLNVADGKIPEKHQRLNVADAKIPEKHHPGTNTPIQTPNLQTLSDKNCFNDELLSQHILQVISAGVNFSLINYSNDKEPKAYLGLYICNECVHFTKVTACQETFRYFALSPPFRDTCFHGNISVEFLPLMLNISRHNHRMALVVFLKYYLLNWIKLNST